MTLKPGQQPEIKQEEENLPVLSLLSDWQLSVKEVFSYLSLN
jgi:hypothetical protein